MRKPGTQWPTLKRLLAYGSPWRKPLSLAVLLLWIAAIAEVSGPLLISYFIDNMTGIFAAKSLGGVGYAEGVTMVHQLLVQLESIAITVVWSAVVAFIGYKLADMTVGLRVPEEQEREGLDVNSHGENAYNA